MRNLDEDPHSGMTPDSLHQANYDRFVLPTPLLSPVESIASNPSSSKGATSPRSTISRVSRSKSLPRLNLLTSAKKQLLKSPPQQRQLKSPPISPQMLASPADFDSKTRAGDTNKQGSESKSGLASFFRWQSSNDSAHNKVTKTPTKDSTPASNSSSASNSSTKPSSTEVRASSKSSAYSVSHSSHHGQTHSPETPTQQHPHMRRRLESELKQVSEELASSIKREMDLEDQVTHLQNELKKLGGDTRGFRKLRSSDYFSDGSQTPSALEIHLEELRKQNDALTEENRTLQLQSRTLKAQLSSTKEKPIENLTAASNKQSTDQIKLLNSQHQRQMNILKQRTVEAESQRDNLHQALRQLRERQVVEARMANERISQLENERKQSIATAGQPPLRGPQTPDRLESVPTMTTPRALAMARTKELEERYQRELRRSDELVSQNRDLQSRFDLLLKRTETLEATAASSAISDAAASASLLYAHKLAIEMSRITNMHITTHEKIRQNTQQNATNGALTPMLQASFKGKFSPQVGSAGGRFPKLDLEQRIKTLESQLQASTDDLATVVMRMQGHQIQMIELETERDEEVLRERREAAQQQSVESVESLAIMSN